jgi:lactate dehydrogenase-like 2-hydroxyacid dehydrogenase
LYSKGNSYLLKVVNKFNHIACVGFNGSELDELYWQEIDSLCNIKTFYIHDKDVSLDTDALLVKLGAKIGKDSIDRLPNLKYIGMLGTGYGGIDVGYATKKGICVTNIADYATEAVAECTFGMILNHIRDLPRALIQTKSGNYADDFTGSEIKGKKFGIIGLGAIGMRTAELALAFGADVYYWSRSRKKSAERIGVKYYDLDKLLGSCDIITLNLALNSDTENIINRDRVGLIKSNAIFINPSPMELIDYEALKERLSINNLIFIMDHTDEVTSAQLRELEQYHSAVMYPPIGYITTEASNLKKRIYTDNIENFLIGKPTNAVS